MKKTWYQVRIFVKAEDSTFVSTGHWWSISVIGDIIKRFVDEYPKTRFWFTKYYCPLSVDDECSKGLPDDFFDTREDAIWTRSLRFRFQATDEKQVNFLKKLMRNQTKYWYEGVRPYNHLDDLCGPRFTNSDKIKDRRRRGDIVQKALEYNCRLILDCLRNVNDLYWELEESDNPNNTAFGNISRSMTHLYVNPWISSSGESLPIYGIKWSAIYGI